MTVAELTINSVLASRLLQGRSTSSMTARAFIRNPPKSGGGTGPGTRRRRQTGTTICAINCIKFIENILDNTIDSSYEFSIVSQFRQNCSSSVSEATTINLRLSTYNDGISVSYGKPFSNSLTIIIECDID